MNLMEKYLKKVKKNYLSDTFTSRQIFENKFNELADKLSRYALTADEIKTQNPDIYGQIQDSINDMDSAWLKGDAGAFSTAVKTIEALYFKALQQTPKR
jgi:hypothetical protein